MSPMEREAGKKENPLAIIALFLAALLILALALWDPWGESPWQNPSPEETAAEAGIFIPESPNL